ncbi:MAG: hypothetical protein II208_04025 [Alphaproteobacteria bacterium]|nr:hypothetical protein [Alphaproteobacteria bacterium]
MNKEIVPVKIKSNIYLNMSNRMYLSVVRQDISDKLIYVYTLGCPGSQNDSFYMKTNADVATFNNREKADLYTGTVHQIMQVQSTWPLYSMAYKALKAEIDAFNHTIKSMCDNQKTK